METIGAWTWLPNEVKNAWCSTSISLLHCSSTTFTTVHPLDIVGERPHSRFSPSAHAVSRIPPKLHQSDNTDHTKRQFELVTRLGQSRISNYAAFSMRPPLCPVRYTTGTTVCSVNYRWTINDVGEVSAQLPPHNVMAECEFNTSGKTGTKPLSFTEVNTSFSDNCLVSVKAVAQNHASTHRHALHGYSVLVQMADQTEWSDIQIL
jgi:hypothetical protein